MTRSCHSRENEIGGLAERAQATVWLGIDSDPVDRGAILEGSPSNLCFEDWYYEFLELPGCPSASLPPV